VFIAFDGKTTVMLLVFYNG